MNRIVSHSMSLILGTENMKELGIAIDFKSQDDNHWWDHLANEKHQPSARG
jgi:hypothetical protein